MLKIKFAEDAAKEDPFARIWAERLDAADKGRRLESQSTAGYVFMMAVSAITCFLALALAGYGLYQITSPALSIVEGLVFATMGGVIVIGSSAALQFLGAKVARIVREGRESPSDRDPAA